MRPPAIHACLSAALLMSALLAGCGTYPNGVRVTVRYVDQDGALEPVQSIAIEDAALSKKVTVTAFGFANHTGAIMAMNTIRSNVARPLDLEYRVDWLDADGGVVPNDFVFWHAFTLAPEDSRFLNQNLTVMAAGYRLTVRRPQ